MIRVAAAAAVENLKPSETQELAVNLLRDPDVGVRKTTVQSLAELSRRSVDVPPHVTAQLRAVAEVDPEPALRRLAAQASPER